MSITSLNFVTLRWAATGGRRHAVVRLAVPPDAQPVRGQCRRRTGKRRIPAVVAGGSDLGGIPVTDLPVYDEVPQRWAPSGSSDDFPAFSLTPGYQRACHAMTSQERVLIVDIRCTGSRDNRPCRRPLGGVWSKPHGLLLIVKAHLDTSRARGYKRSPTVTGRLAVRTGRAVPALIVQWREVQIPVRWRGSCSPSKS